MSCVLVGPKEGADRHADEPNKDIEQSHTPELRQFFLPQRGGLGKKKIQKLSHYLSNNLWFTGALARWRDDAGAVPRTEPAMGRVARIY